MQFFSVLLQLMGATMLLLYSVRMVRTGMERASGPVLRTALIDPDRGQIKNAGFGVLVAIMLQSSTAAAILAVGFVSRHLIASSAGLAILLGADLGSALVVQILSFNLKWLIPVLLLVGGWLFLKFEARKVKQTGRILLGIALILITLGMIGAATMPLKESESLPLVVGYLGQDPVLAFAVGAILTFSMHSSVAGVLLFMAFATEGVLPVSAGISLVLGANFGGGLIAVWLTRGADPVGRRIPVGNFIFRGLGSILALALFTGLQPSLDWMGGGVARQLVGLHVIFNFALVLVCLPLTGPMDRLVSFLIREKPVHDVDAIMRPASALDRSLISVPSLALASATRELLRMSETVEIMVRPIMDFFDKADHDQVDRIRALDEEVDVTHTAIKLYIAEVNRGELSAEDSERGMELTNFAINLERAGDIVAKNLLNLTLQKHKRKLRFSDAGWRELNDLHAQVMVNIQLALNVLISEDLDSARQLIAEKDRMRALEHVSHERHLDRLRSGSEESIDSSDLHLETVRGLKEINSLFASIAYPILTKNGQLLETRLADVDV